MSYFLPQEPLKQTTIGHNAEHNWSCDTQHQLESYDTTCALKAQETNIAENELTGL